MNALYQKWEAQGASFHYVTLSPWQLYGVYSAFMTKEGFPAGTFHMTHFGIVDGSILKRMTSAMDRKLPMVKALMEQFPQREFVLVGDSGQHDPEVYGAVARDYGDRVKAIFIRNVSEESPDSARLQNAFRGVPAEKWKLFTDAATLSLD
jgi:phosphatidate phosphatase APP1